MSPSLYLSFPLKEIFIWLHWVSEAAHRSWLLHSGSQLRHVGSSSPVRTRTQPSCIGSSESYPLDHQGGPYPSLWSTPIQPSHKCCHREYVILPVPSLIRTSTELDIWVPRCALTLYHSALLAWLFSHHLSQLVTCLPFSSAPAHISPHPGQCWIPVCFADLCHSDGCQVISCFSVYSSYYWDWASFPF